MQNTLGILFTICSVLFALCAGFFLSTVLIAWLRPDMLYYNASGYGVSLLMTLTCTALAYALFLYGRRLRSMS